MFAVCANGYEENEDEPWWKCGRGEEKGAMFITPVTFTKVLMFFMLTMRSLT
jgi:hypothetical protein